MAPSGSQRTAHACGEAAVMRGFSGGERSARVNRLEGARPARTPTSPRDSVAPPLHSVTLATELKVGPSDRPH